MKRALPFALAISFLLSFAVTSSVLAAGHVQRPAPRTVLLVSPAVASVGQWVTLSVVAPYPSAVRISLRSPHHAWSGMASWRWSSRSYIATVRLIPRVHGLEQAQVVAWVTPRSTGRAYVLYNRFWIRGLSMGMGMGMGY